MNNRTRFATIGWIACAAAAAAVALPARAQPAADSLELSRLTAQGSEPYKDAVTRYLNKQEPKIIGGAIAAVGAYPWQVSLGVSWIASPHAAHFCGGSILAESWILTAAHCVVRTPPENILVVAGANRLDGGAIRRNVKKVIVHKSYDRITKDNDVALLQLQDALPLASNPSAIPRVTVADEPALLTDGRMLVVTGWGHTVENGSAVRDLRFVRVPFVERGTCNRPLAYDGRITDNMLCAGVTAGGQDSCQGDSGGPLATTEEPHQLVGVVSWGEGCARPNKVGIYARVARFGDWIDRCLASPDTCNL